MKPVKRGWCPACDQTMWHEPESENDLRPLVCARCKTDMIPEDQLSEGRKVTFRMQSWFDDVKLADKMGRSPGGAAQKLGCSRSMIDRLVERGILERAEYDQDGFKLVFISERSVQKALENKKATGKWTQGGEADDLAE